NSDCADKAAAPERDEADTATARTTVLIGKINIAEILRMNSEPARIFALLSRFRKPSSGRKQHMTCIHETPSQTSAGPRHVRFTSNTGHVNAQQQNAALCHYRTYAPQQNDVLRLALFDHLVGTDHERQRHVNAERLGGFEVDDQLEPGGLLDGE